MPRRLRKRLGALWMASQQTGEFLDKEHGRQILSAVGAKLLMGVSPVEAKCMQGPLELSAICTHIPVVSCGLSDTP